jgi:hypothetical protein
LTAASKRSAIRSRTRPVTTIAKNCRRRLANARRRSRPSSRSVPPPRPR